MDFKILLSLFFSSILLSNCNETVEITYDVYFWSDSVDNLEGKNTLFIDGIEKGILFNPLIEVDCTSDESILNQLVYHQLSNGEHVIEVRNEDGLVRSAGGLELQYNGQTKSLGLSSGGTIGAMESKGNDECLTIKISF